MQKHVPSSLESRFRQCCVSKFGFWAMLVSFGFSIANAQETQTSIDALVAKELAAKNARMNGSVDKRTLARRVSLALTGRLPSQESVQKFVQSDELGAYESMVDELLASPQFAEHAAVAWLESVGYADAFFEDASWTSVFWPYRDWVVSAIEQDLPYDEFITWQLAGDMLPNPTQEQLLATAFQKIHRNGSIEDLSEPAPRFSLASQRVDTLGTAILGLSLGCARCHDHKSLPISTAEYDRLCNMFDNVEVYSLMLLLDKNKQNQVSRLEKAMSSIRQAYRDEVAKLAQSDAVENWYSSLGQWPVPDESHLVADFVFDPSNASDNKATAQRIRNLVTESQPGKWEAPLTWGKDGSRSFLRLDGARPIEFPEVGVFSRTEEFTLCMELQIPAWTRNASILNRKSLDSNAGSSGYELSVIDGHLKFRLFHQSIGNSIEIRCIDKVPFDQWVHVAVVYGGSNLAEDVRVYLNGTHASSTVVHDTLRQDFYARGRDATLSIGGNSASPLAGAKLSTFQVYNAALTEVEMSGLVTDSPLLSWEELSPEQQQAWTVHFAHRMDPQCRYHKESFSHYFQSLNDLLGSVPEIPIMSELRSNAPKGRFSGGSKDNSGVVGQTDVRNWMRLADGSVPEDRLALAQCLTTDYHPLTARVAANNIWRQMFGKGIDDKDGEIGTLETTTSGSGLLDHFAGELIRSGWSRKAIFRQIALSDAFKQSGEVPIEGVLPEVVSKYIPRQKLSGEETRDCILQVSGLLDEKVGGAPQLPHQVVGAHRSCLYLPWLRKAAPPIRRVYNENGREICSVGHQAIKPELQHRGNMSDALWEACSQAVVDELVGWKVEGFPFGERDFPQEPSMYFRENREKLIGSLTDAKLEIAISNAYEKLMFRECPERTAEELRKSLRERVLRLEDKFGRGDYGVQARRTALRLVVMSILQSDEFRLNR